jgi:hypothetical protein
MHCKCKPGEATRLTKNTKPVLIFMMTPLKISIYIGDYVSGGLAFSYNKYIIAKSHLGITTLNYYPEFTVNAYLVIKPIVRPPANIKWLHEISIIPRIDTRV